MRTTCVATRLEAGHAQNALPQVARATLSCRLLPGVAADEIQQTLVKVLANEKIGVSMIGEFVPSPASPLKPEIVQVVERLTSELWPGIPVIPTMSTGATDSRFLRNAGIPTYGISGLFVDMEGSGTHGKDERIRVKSLYEGQEFLYRLVKSLSSGK